MPIPAGATARPAVPVPATVPVAVPAERPAHRERPLLRLLAGESASTLGDQVWYVALSWAAVRTAGPAAAGAVMTAGTLPRLALMVFAGPLADRFDARRLMLGSDAARAALLLGAAAAALASPGLVLLVVVSLLLGAADALFLPASGSLRPRLLTPGQLQGAAALRELALRAGLILGAPLGGLLTAHGGLPLACAVDALTFAASFWAVRPLRPRPAAPVSAAARPSYGRALRDGFAALRQNRVVLALLAATLLTNLGFVGPMNVGLALLARQHGWGGSGIGELLAAFGVGAALGAAALLRFPVRRGIGWWVAGAIAVQAGALMLLALSARLPVAVSAAALVGVAGSVVGVSCTALGQARTPDGVRGRISAVQSLLSLGVAPLAVAATGFAAALFGTAPALLGSAAIELLAAALCLSVRQLRTADHH